MSAAALPYHPAMTLADPSWRAELSLDFRSDAGRTTLARRQHHGPLVVQRPFYPEAGVCHVYLVHPPGGIVGGDKLRLEVRTAANAQVLLTTPGATRFYKAGPHPQAQLTQTLHVDNAELEWLPQETIVFDGANAHTRTRVTLSGEAKFIGWEICCLGRPASSETFSSGGLRQHLELWFEDRPVLLDRLRLHGGSEPLTAAWGLAGACALGTFIAWPASQDDVNLLRDITTPSVRGTITLVDRALHCRALAAQGESVRRHFLALWQALRPRLLRRDAVLPRIWAT
jgi:urease accessory protein